MRHRLKMICLAFVFCSYMNAIGCSDAGSKREAEVPPQSSNTWELPEGMFVTIGTLHASPTGHHVVFLASNPKSDWRSARCAILDTRSGKVNRVSDLCKTDEKGILDAAAQSEFSRNGKHLLVNGESRFPATVIDLTSGRTTEILDTRFPRVSRGWWYGDNIAVSTVDYSQGATTHPIRIISFEGKAIRTLPVYGEIVEADRNGRFLVVLTDPKDPSKSMPRETLTGLDHLLVVNAEGKTLRDLGAVLHTPTWKVIVSPNGAYLAFAVSSSREEVGGGKKKMLKVVSMLDGSRRSILAGMPVAVTDRGELITWDVGGAVSSNKDGPVISTFSVFSISGADGKKRILFEEDRGVLNATLANGRVYYLSRLTNGRLAISWMKLR